MENRLVGIVATLWFFVTLLSLFIALAFSPMGLLLLLPGINPTTWIYPAFLALPPIALGCQNVMGKTISRLLLWLLTSVMTAAVLLLSGYLAMSIVGH